jgi:RecA-family ATPase
MTATAAVPLGVCANEDRNIIGAFAANALADKPVPPREWHVEGLIPANTVTMLNGDGGTGESLLALQLAVATALSASWIGRPVLGGRVVYFSAEDDVDELHRRLADIAKSLNVGIADFGNLKIAPMAGRDALLAMPEGKGNVLKTTPLFAELEYLLQSTKPKLIIIDTLADVFGGDENQRAQARQFVSALRRLSIQQKAATLLLAHPSRSGIASGGGFSGSTGWANSVREMLYVERVTTKDGAEPDPDLRVLRIVKANYDSLGGEIRMRWREGVFVATTAAQTSKILMAVQAKAEAKFLELLETYAAEGRNVSAKAGHGYAPALFAKDARADGINKSSFADAMNRLFAQGRIKVVEHGPPSRRVGRLEVNAV